MLGLKKKISVVKLTASVQSPFQPRALMKLHYKEQWLEVNFRIGVKCEQNFQNKNTSLLRDSVRFCHLTVR